MQQEPTPPPPPPPRKKKKKKKKQKHHGMTDVPGSGGCLFVRNPPPPPPPRSDLSAAGLNTTVTLASSSFMYADLVRGLQNPEQAAAAAAAAAARLSEGKSVYCLLGYFSFNILMRNESHFLIEMSPISHYLGITSH